MWVGALRPTPVASRSFAYPLEVNQGLRAPLSSAKVNGEPALRISISCLTALPTDRLTAPPPGSFFLPLRNPSPESAIRIPKSP